MIKAQVIAKIDKSWDEFNFSYSGLSEEQFLQSGVMDEWSVKDLLAHVSWWEEETLTHLPEILHGVRQQRYSVVYGGIDAFNALKTKEWQLLSLEEVKKKFLATHKSLMDYLDTVPEEHFSSKTRFYSRLRWDTFGHYPFHAQAIRDWRETHP